MKKRTVPLGLLCAAALALLVQSCQFSSPRASRYAGVYGYAYGSFSGFGLNLGLAEISLGTANRSMGPYFGIGLQLPRKDRPQPLNLGLFGRSPIPFPWVSVQLLPILTRNVFHRGYLVNLQVLIVCIRF